MKTLDVQQGSTSWMAARAWPARCASDAPAVMGASKYISRSDLVRQKALGHNEDISPEVQALFDRGHQAEAAARGILEMQLLDDLFTKTCTTDDGVYLASMDGITNDGTVGFEHKLLNASLVAQVQARDLEPHYYWQLEHQLLVTGAEYIIFVTSDGTVENFHTMEYHPVAGRREALVAAWDQFAKDVHAYVHKAVPDQVVAADQPSLPAVIVNTEGQIAIRDNLPEFGMALKAYIARLPAKPSTDQEFADADAACKTLKKAEDALQAEEDRALASMTSVEDLRKTIANLRAIARQTRLATEKLVEKRKLELRAEIVAEYRAKLALHYETINVGMCHGLLPVVDGDWAGAMKNKRTIQGLRDGCDDLLAKCKIEANERAFAVNANLQTINAAGRPHLFADKAQLVTKDPEAVKAIVNGRIAADDARIEREAAALREKAEREAREKIEREEREKIAAQARAEREAAEALGKAQQPVPIIEMQVGRVDGFIIKETPQVVVERRVPASHPTLALGHISTRLGFQVTGAFLRQLGFEPAAQVKAAMLYHESDFPAICRALIEHIESVIETAPA